MVMVTTYSAHRLLEQAAAEEEGRARVARSVRRDEPWALAWARQHARDFVAAGCPKALLRGARNGYHDYMTLAPDLTAYRQSADTKGYYTHVMSASARWEGYPAREVICTTREHVAMNYGNVYVVVPKDGARFAVAPSPDLWAAFEKTVPHGMSVPALNGFFANAHLRATGAKLTDEREACVAQLMAVRLADVPDLPEQPDTHNGRLMYDALASLRRRFADRPDATLFEAFDSCLDPAANGFEVTTLAGISARSARSAELGPRECWTSWECLLVRDSQADAFFKKLQTAA